MTTALSRIALIGCLAIVASAQSSVCANAPTYIAASGESWRGRESALLVRYAPVFVVGDSQDAANRIGTPEIHRERVIVNPETPAIFAEVRHDRIGSTSVLQLVYRVHFQKIPF